jgi:tetratricopeptide (TPR) repeat protein
MIRINKLTLLALLVAGLGNGCSTGTKSIATDSSQPLASEAAPLVLNDYENGKALLQRGQSVMALNAFNAALKKDPSNVELLNAKGGALFALGHYETAIEVFESAIKLAPNAAHIYSNLGYAQSRLGQSERAAESLLTALGLEPNDRVARSHWIAVMGSIGTLRADHWKERLANLSSGKTKVADVSLIDTQAKVAVDNPNLPKEIAATSVVNLQYPNSVVAAAEKLIESPTATYVINLKHPDLVEPKMDANTLANQGKDLLLAGDSTKAMATFKAALKIDALNKGARSGMSEIIASKDMASNQVAIMDQKVSKQPLLAAARKEPAQPSNAAKSLRVLISNGIGKSGLACREAKALTSRGWKAKDCVDHKNFTQQRTVILYVPGREKAALRLRNELAQPNTITLRQVSSLSRNAEVQILIGKDWVQPRTSSKKV